MSDYPAVPGVLFVAGFGPVTRDPARSKHFFADTVGLPLSESEGVPDYLTADHSLHGVKHFALWPLSHASVSCFGQDSWPPSHPVPQAWVEFEVRDLAAATEFLQSQGYPLLVANRTEPWGQSVTRLLSPEGLLVGLTITPWLRDNTGE